MTGPTTIDGIVLTKTQIDALIVKLRELATPFDGGITGAAMVEAASALALLASRPAVPTYQVSAGGQWTTVTEAQYDAWSGKKRVALAASPTAPAQSCGDAEQVAALAPSNTEPPHHIIDAAMDVARFEYGHGVTRASIVAIWNALGSPWYVIKPLGDAEQADEAVNK